MEQYGSSTDNGERTASTVVIETDDNNVSFTAPDKVNPMFVKLVFSVLTNFVTVSSNISRD